MKISPKLIACIVGVVLLAAILLTFGILIRKEKKILAKDSYLQKPPKHFWAIFVLAVVLNVLPFLIPLKLYVIIAIEGCGCAGSFAVLRERYVSLLQANGK